jgi:ABC-2 type transport system permease protein
VNGAVIRKTIRDSLPLLVIITAAVILLETLLAAVISDFSKELEYLWLKKPIFSRFAEILLGADLGDELSSSALMTIGFAHPLLFALTWTFVLTTCSRVLVGEIERGTADLLLTLPISRASIYVSVSAVWTLAGIPICLGVLIGSRLGAQLFGLSEPPTLSRLAIVGANLLALFLAAGAAMQFASSVASRRAPAVGCVLAVLLASFLLSFLGQFWSVAERVRFLGLLHYYRPLLVVRSGEWPVRDLVVLLGLGLVLWTAGLWRFSRRDIPAV